MFSPYSFSSSLSFQPFKTPKSPLAFSFARFRILTCTSELDAPKPKPKFSPDKQKAGTKSRRKFSYGTSRRSVLKKTFSQEQGPILDDPVVGIIGGGMSGIICALYLEKRGVRSPVFDTLNPQEHRLTSNGCISQELQGKKTAIEALKSSPAASKIWELTICFCILFMGYSWSGRKNGNPSY